MVVSISLLGDELENVIIKTARPVKLLEAETGSFCFGLMVKEQKYNRLEKLTCAKGKYSIAGNFLDTLVMYANIVDPFPAVCHRSLQDVQYKGTEYKTASESLFVGVVNQFGVTLVC